MNTHDHDPVEDPMAGILADLETLRKSRENAGFEVDAPHERDQVTLDALEDIAEAAGHLRDDDPTYHGGSPSGSRRGRDSRDLDDFDDDDDYDDDDFDDEDEDSEDSTDSRYPAEFPQLDPLSSIFSNRPSAIQTPQSFVPSTPDASFDPRNPFAFLGQLTAEPDTLEPISAPTSGLLTFQAPQAELGEVVDPTWSPSDDDTDDLDDSGTDDSGTDETYDSDDRSFDRSDDRADDDADDSIGSRRRRRGRRSRGRDADDSYDDSDTPDYRRRGSTRSGEENGEGDNDLGDGGDQGTSRRRRRRRPRSGDDSVMGVKGSTRLEAKRLRRRENREAGRRRPLVTEAEFLARRESVERVMLVRERDGRTQLVVTEDGIAVEHYMSEPKAQSSLIGNVYLGKVQNVLPSMEAAFVDIGKGRNAVLYAGEVNWDVLGMDGKPRRIEVALNSGDSVLVQVTKDPIGHKGARLTSQISLPGRFLVYVPGNPLTGISRKLPEVERIRLRQLLEDVVPEGSGVIVRTAAEGAREDELRRDIERLAKRWDSIEKKSTSTKILAPHLLYSEPDMIVRVIRDVFNEDFANIIIDGDTVYDTIYEYVETVAPDLLERVQRFDGDGDIFERFRVEEQIEKALSRKVNLPSGGSLVIDRTEAMTVIDVNTGKFTGSGGNLEETVTKNNLEAAEEVIRQLRLRDIGGIIVVDFIDMVLESNRDLVVRRLVECLGRDRTKHQVAEVTSLGLIQMTRKRIGTGLAEGFAAAGADLRGKGLVLPGTEPENMKQYKSRKKRTRSDESGRGGSDNSVALPNGRKGAGTEMAAIAAASMKPRVEEVAEAQPQSEVDAQPEVPEVEVPTPEVPEPTPTVHAPGTIMIGDDSETKVQAPVKKEPAKKPAKKRTTKKKVAEEPAAPALPVLIIGAED